MRRWPKIDEPGSRIRPNEPSAWFRNKETSNTFCSSMATGLRQSDNTCSGQEGKDNDISIWKKNYVTNEHNDAATIEHAWQDGRRSVSWSHSRTVRTRIAAPCNVYSFRIALSFNRTATLEHNERAFSLYGIQTNAHRQTHLMSFANSLILLCWRNSEVYSILNSKNYFRLGTCRF